MEKELNKHKGYTISNDELRRARIDLAEVRAKMYEGLRPKEVRKR
jgi:hypothetical protein